MGLAFWLSQLLLRKNLLQALIGEQLELPDAGVAAAQLRVDRLLRR